MNSKVSLVIPTFNSDKTIKEVIVGALSQSINFDEIIVVNDCSNDDTYKILNEFNNIKLINNKKNMGLSYSRNEGIRNSKNDIVACIDADVVIDKEWLESIFVNLKHDKIVLCGGNLIEKYIEKNCNKWRSIRYKQNYGEKDIINPPFIFGSNFIQYKSIWQKINGFDETLRTNGEDVDYSRRIKELNYDTYYSSKSKCYHLQNDNINTLANRVWRYHTFSYKIKKISVYRFFKIIIKQFNILLKRTIEDIFKLRFKFMFINFIVFFKFVILELKRTLGK